MSNRLCPSLNESFVQDVNSELFQLCRREWLEELSTLIGQGNRCTTHVRSTQLNGQSASMEYFDPKNLILAGVKSVMLHEEGVLELWDLSNNFIFSEEDVRKNCARASLQKL
ncbi:ubiquitin-activating enzyme E1 2-like [Silene latifolia]|uniref:ubiquitin-activating enzyme E1 2-like n=1 Tax=Silene latifolia TaxID=37657 RepID=UPI003D77D8BF